jgi:hypothetical protein
MPPRADLLDYFGADAIGGVVGLWLRFCVNLPRLLLSHLRIRRENRLESGSKIDYLKRTHSGVSIPFQWGRAKISRIVVATLVTLVVWAIATSKPVWNLAGPDGDRILAGVLMLVNATWVILVFYILLSRPKKKRLSVGSHR